jgi:hypothetical protein
VFEKLIQVDIVFLVNYIIRSCSFWKINFIILFGLLSIRLSIYHDLGRGFGRVAKGFFRSFFIPFYFILQSSILFKIKLYLFFLIFFLLDYLIYMILLASFDDLTRVCWYFFFIDIFLISFFYILILSDWKLLFLSILFPLY